MDRFETHLIDTSPCGSGTATYRFEKPAGFTFFAGQFTMLEVECETGFVRKPFTIASAPEDPWLEFTTRMSDSCFKLALAAMEAGAPAAVSSASGNLVLPPGHGPVGFLVGGVGVTPAHSILRHEVLAGSGIEAILIYGNRDAACMPYAEEFDAMAARGGDGAPLCRDSRVGPVGERGPAGHDQCDGTRVRRAGRARGASDDRAFHRICIEPSPVWNT